MLVETSGAFDVSPLTLSLSGKTATGTIAITNRSKDVLRLHVTAFKWSQRADGEAVLKPTKEVVFFPAMISLNPNQSRQIRVGSKVKPGAVERTYRIFVQELPPLTKKEDTPNAVKVLTKLGMPVFVAAQRPKVTPGLTAPAVSGKTLTFSARNTGNTHMRIKQIKITARNPKGEVERIEQAGWYVLANGRRDYQIPLSDKICEQATTIEVDMETTDGSVKANLPTLSCGSG